ncbi:MAG TPA: hypothetical protein VE871_01980 [Longimicrobium sp.]|nr:hypothetical protein [Longimicrobium sp.]
MESIRIIIVGGSRKFFDQKMLSRLLVQPRLASFISRAVAFPHAEIILTERVNADLLVPHIIGFLKRQGISQGDIRIRHPTESIEAKIPGALAGGLRESGLDFGADVAERDDGLSRYFVSTHSYQAIRDHRRHIVVGPKGSGKSAILKELTAENSTTLVITPEHYATELLDAIIKNPVSTELAAFITTWKYTLLIEIFRTAVQHQVGTAESLKRIRQYLIVHGHSAGELSLFERFLMYLRRISQVKGKIGPAETEIGLEPNRVEELGKLFKMDELLVLVPDLQKVLRRTTLTVYVDELDQSWNNSEMANRFLISLLTAAIQLRGIAENLHVVVFLRSEIFDLIKPYLPQLDKLRSDIETLHWSRRELRDLIAKRALDSLSLSDSKVDLEQVIKTIFPVALEGTGLDGLDFAITRTSRRPRELIQICNLALYAAAELDYRLIQADAILRAEEEFSKWKAEHIVAEYMYIYPGLKALVERFRGKPRRMSYSALDAEIGSIILQFQEDSQAPAWISTAIEPLEIIQILYEIELIGIEKIGAPAGDGRQPWESYDYVFSRPSGKPELSQTFLFHPGVWKALEMV